MRVGGRVSWRGDRGTVTKLNVDGSIVVKWDRAVTPGTHCESPGCNCGGHARSRFETIGAERARKMA